MSTFTSQFSWRRGFAVLLGLFAAYAFLDCTMMVVDEFPRRSLDPYPEHWWLHFIIGSGVVLIIGCVAVWGAFRLWRAH